MFGSGRLEEFPLGATGPVSVSILSDIQLDIKIDQKAIYGDGAWAVAAFDGRRTLDISAKHYKLSLAGIATDFNGVQSAGAKSVVFDEAGIVGPNPTYTYALNQATNYVAGSADVIVYVQGANGKTYPVQYAIVAAGSEVAGQSCSITAGVLKFAAGDVALALSVTYQWNSTNGNAVTLSQTYQNSSPFMTMALYKRDRSPIDGSLGILLCELGAVRPGQMTIPFKENEALQLDRKFMAFADPTGYVAKFTFVNV
jgi:hypothetical protein